MRWWARQRCTLVKIVLELTQRTCEPIMFLKLHTWRPLFAVLILVSWTVFLPCSCVDFRWGRRFSWLDLRCSGLQWLSAARSRVVSSDLSLPGLRANCGARVIAPPLTCPSSLYLVAWAVGCSDTDANAVRRSWFAHAGVRFS